MKKTSSKVAHNWPQLFFYVLAWLPKWPRNRKPFNAGLGIQTRDKANFLRLEEEKAQFDRKDLKTIQNNGKRFECSQNEKKVPYTREQKHVLLFRKSDFLFFKVSNTNMRHIFFLGIPFFFVKIERF